VRVRHMPVPLLLVRSRRPSPAGPLAAIVLPLGLFEYLTRLAPQDPVIRVPHHHFVIVSAASLAATGLAVAVGLAGIRQRNLEVSVLALAFASLGALFALHGLSTPGFLLPPTPVPAVAAQMSVLVAACWLALSAMPSDVVPMRLLGRHRGVVLGLWVAVLGAAVLMGLRRPDLWARIPLTSPPLNGAAAVAAIAASAYAGIRYWTSYTYSRFPLQRAIVYASGWLAVSQWIITYGTVWRMSWWIYHLLLLAATLVLAGGLWRQYALGTPLPAAVRGLFMQDPVQRLEAGLSPSIRALVAATEARDPYTAGHSHRVTLAAVQLAEALGVAPDRLRALAQGGMVHDVGKLGIPERILNKPGPLTSDERRTVEQHPLIGYEMCRRLGFMDDALAVIRSHHERWDGTGYPDGLAGEHIPLLARILAVADVYDALTSARSYRPAWSSEQARAYIVAQAGAQFDPRVVQAWVRLLTPQPAAARSPQPTAATGGERRAIPTECV
jgi:putative nucleotidyltransferase with HDIG domain